MTYNHTRQYRFQIIRGKAIKDLDNLLPLYINILNEITPVDNKNFKIEFDDRLKKHLSDHSEKALDNHRTETAGKLFGLYYEDEEGVIRFAERARKLLEDSDQPAFFKDLCAKSQFPTGMNVARTIQEQSNMGVSIRQLCFVLACLKQAESSGIFLNKKEVGYYILNSLDVFTHNATPEDVVNQILADRSKNIIRKIEYPNKQYSYCYQHIIEQINLLILANLVYTSGEDLILNRKEQQTINTISSKWNENPLFDFSIYDLSKLEERKKAEIDWDLYYSMLSDVDPKELYTSMDSLIKEEVGTTPIEEKPSVTTNNVELGNEGEDFIFNVERQRVAKNKPRLVNKVINMSAIKGIGYDIQSVWAEGKFPEFVKYIEVKSTKRVTLPPAEFIDTINLTRNEWTAAQQHGKNFFIYRVYFSSQGVKIFIIDNPSKKAENEQINVIPLCYRVDFDHLSGSFYENFEDKTYG